MVTPRQAVTIAAPIMVAVALIAGQALAQTPPAATADAATHKLIAKTCTSCHVISQVTAQRKNADQWAGTVDQMIGYGVQVSDAEYAKIVDYLAKHHGPGSAQRGVK